MYAAAGLSIAIYCAIALLRMRYPFELEWMEGGMVDHVRRILAGQSVYARPSLEFTAYPYTPFYYYVSAAVARFTGIGFLPLRLVSFLSSLGCFAVIFAMVRRETRSTFSAAIATGLFAAAYRVTGAWFDIARVDSLFLLLLLLTLYFVRFAGSWRAYTAAAVLASLAVFTKQAALAALPPVMLFAVIRRPRSGILFSCAIVLATGAGIWIMDRSSDGWFSFYTLHLPRVHPVMRTAVIRFWTQDILTPLSIAFAVCLVYAVVLLSSFRRNSLFYPMSAAGMIGASWYSTLIAGAYANDLIPACAAIAIMFGLATHKAMETSGYLPAEKRPMGEVAICVLCLIQFGCLLYNPLRQIPTKRDLAAGRALIRTMAAMNGEVLLPFHGYIPVLAGKASAAHEQAVSDTIAMADPKATASLVSELKRGLQARRFSAIITDRGWFQQDLQRYYEKQRTVFADDDVFWPVTGAHVRPQDIWVPKLKTPLESTPASRSAARREAGSSSRSGRW